MKRSTPLAAGLITVTVMLSSCSTGQPEPTTEAAAPSTTAPNTADSTAEVQEVVAGDLTAAPWARGLLDVGEEIAQIDVDGLQVTVRYVESVPAADSKSGTSAGEEVTLFEAGDPIHYVNVVVANTTSEPIVMNGTLNLNLFPDGWEYLNVPVAWSVPAIRDLELVESAIGEVQDDSQYPLAPGEAYSFTEATWAPAGEVSVRWSDPDNGTHSGTAPFTIP